MTLHRRTAALLVILAAAVAVVPVAATAASAATPGYLRLAHLSPDTPEVDVWVTSFRGSAFSKVFPGVGYGTLSEYQRLSPGTYTVAMRPPGAPGDTAPLIRTTLTVTTGEAYTVAGVGRNANLSLRVLSDDLARPSQGKARMRVVQASSVAGLVDVTTTTGSPIALAARFPSTTPYAEVAAQEWTLRATPEKQGVEADEETVQVQAGLIYTTLVLDRGKSGVQLVVRADAAAAASTPVGSVDTGLGGAAGARPSSALIGLSLVLIAAACAALRRRRLG